MSYRRRRQNLGHLYLLRIKTHFEQDEFENQNKTKSKVIQTIESKLKESVLLNLYQ